MANSIVIYFLKRLAFYCLSFVDTYFRGGFNFFNTLYWQLFFSLERRLSFIVSIRYFFVPLWQEYSVASYMLSIPIRIFKIIIGAISLGIFSLIFWCFYLVWIIAPFYLLIKIIVP
ncbi:MAG: hypothetical protein GYA31_01830 [Parcubacteria group bacterium]|nr:hypothetical protein [Parcubacteria group bacterium]